MGVSRVFWDSNLFIYLFEGSGDLYRRTQQVLVRMSVRGDDLITSALTLGELLVAPVQYGDHGIAARYERFLRPPNVHVFDFNREAARVYGALRADKTIKPPDAIQLACASAAGTNLFITNDDRLSKKKVPGIDFVVPLSKAFL
jgi:predicted nucleic acid-binding protein